MSYFYLDLQTLPTDRVDAREELASDVRPPGTMKKPETIAAWERDEKPAKVEEEVRKTCYDGGLGRLAAAGWAFGDSPVSVFETSDTAEEEVINNALKMFSEAWEMGFPLVAHNALGFHVRWLWQRAVVLGVKVPEFWPLHARPWNTDEVYDTMAVWCGLRETISLDRLAWKLGERPRETDPSEVSALWEAGNYEAVEETCREGVLLLRSVHRRLTNSA